SRRRHETGNCLVNGGEFRRYKVADIQVVIACDGYLARDFYTCFLENSYRADSHPVVDAEEGGGQLGNLREELCRQPFPVMVVVLVGFGLQGSNDIAILY